LHRGFAERERSRATLGAEREDEPPDGAQRRGEPSLDQRDKIRRSGTKGDCTVGSGDCDRPAPSDELRFMTASSGSVIHDPAVGRVEFGVGGLGSGSRSTTQPTTATNPTTTRARKRGRSPAQPIRPMRRSPTDPNAFSVNESRSLTMTISLSAITTVECHASGVQPQVASLMTPVNL
jgi:hypothetical protein